MSWKVSKEKKWVILFAAVVMLVSLIPYWIGFARQGTEWVFTGFVFGVEDGNSYIAKMLSGANGHWLFQSPYTAYPQKGALAFLPYLLLGKLAAQPAIHAQLTVLFHLFRMTAGGLMIVASYDFISVFIKDESARRLGTALATLGGGLGWLAVAGLRVLWANGLPLEFYSPETFGFLSLFGLPHLALARALLLWGLCLFLDFGEVSKTRSAVLAGLAWFAMGFFQPLTVVVGWVVLGVYVALLAISGLIHARKGQEFDGVLWRTTAQRAMIMVLISSPLAVYSFFAFSMDPFLKQWTGQNLILSPPISDYLLGFGLVLPLAVVGTRPLLRRLSSPTWLLIGWVIVFPILAYAPYNLQRRLPEGVWVALVVLALGSLESVKNERQKKAIKGVLALSLMTTGLVYLGAVFTVWHPAAPLYRPNAEVEMFKYLAAIAQDREVVLAAYPTSNALPAWAPMKTVTGHGPESVNLKEVEKRVDLFYQMHTENSNRRELIEEFKVDFVVWGPEEQALGSYDPRRKPFLKEVYRGGEYSLFAVEGGSGTP